MKNVRLFNEPTDVAIGAGGDAHYLTVGPGGEIYVADTSNSFLHMKK